MELFCLSALIYVLAIQCINRVNPTDQLVIISILLSAYLIIQVAQRIRVLNKLNIINKTIERSEKQDLSDLNLTDLGIINQLVIILCNFIRRTRKKAGQFITLNQIENITKYKGREQILLLIPILSTYLIWIALMSDYVLFQYTTIDTTIHSIHSIFSTVTLVDVKLYHLVMLLFIYLLVVEILSLTILSYIRMQNCGKEGEELKANEKCYLTALIVFKILLNPMQCIFALFDTACTLDKIENDNRSLKCLPLELELSAISCLLVNPNMLTI